MSDRFMKGAMILSLSMFLTRLLGLFYLVPFQRLVGLGGIALYGYAYVPYTLLVTLSTLGIPIGMARFIAKYNADGEYDTSRKIFRVGMLIMILVGMLGFLIMWFGAPLLASWAMAGNETAGENLYNSLDDVITAIRMVSFAVIVVPPMSIFRGFFQGNQDMHPTAISQLVEQLVRIVLIISASFVVVRILGGSSQTAVNISVFAAFIAGISSLVVLFRYWNKEKPTFDALLPLTKPHPKRQTKVLFKELLSYALPFALISLSLTWFQMIDNVTFTAGMMRAGVPRGMAQEIFGIFVVILLKMVMIPVSFSIAFSQPLIPEITEKIRLRDFRSVQQTLMTAIMLTSFVTVPAVIGMSMLSNPIFVILSNTHDAEMNAIGGAIFSVGAFIALVMGLNGILSATIQGINRQFKALIFLIIAGVIKLVGNLVLIPIPMLNAYGAIISTILAYAFCLVMNYLEIRKATGIKTRLILKRHFSIFLLTGIMALVVWGTTSILNLFLDYTKSSLQAAIYVAIAGIIGAFVYGVLAIYFDLAKSLFGEKLSYDRIRARFRRRKT